MAKKIGRNDLCPCGSGLKYKKCCMGKNASPVPTLPIRPYTTNNCQKQDAAFVDYCQRHSTHDILNFIIGLQLSPANHGKNVRMEELARLAVLNIHPDGLPIDSQCLENILDEDYSYNSMEDLPCNLFSENVAFYGGSYTVFPGITNQGIEILNNLLYSVFKKKENLPYSAETRIYNGVHAMLFLGKIMAERASVSGNVAGIIQESTEFNYEKCLCDYSVPVQQFEEYLAAKGIMNDALDDFIIDISDPELETPDPDKSPLLTKPIVKYDNKYYFLLVSNEANAISAFIQQQALRYGVEDQICKAMHAHTWDKVQSMCPKMDWIHTTYDFPETDDCSYNEVLCQFDKDWYGYLLFVHDQGESFSAAITNGHIKLEVDNHIRTAISHLKNKPSLREAHILTLILLSSSGEAMMIPHSGAELEDYRLVFSAYDFIELASSENWTQLSLLRFAQTIGRYENCFNMLSDNLDMYSIYKAKGESFYLSDTEKFSSIIIPPDEGRHLIFEAKLKRNFQSVGIISDGKYLSMGVVSALDGYPIFKPVSSMGEYYRVTTSYSVPIWVRNNQNDNMYEFVDLFAMAIVFWTNKISPGCSRYIDANFNLPITILLSIDEDVHDILTPVNKSGCRIEEAFSILLNGNQLNFTVHRAALGLVSGGDNTGEREMIRYLYSSLTGLSEKDMNDLLDVYMPIGPAKMILLTDTGKNEILDPRYLKRPFYIGKAIDQMMLEDLPQKMATIGKDFDGTLSTKEETISFLRDVVNSLLAELSHEVIKYDKPFLLKQLVEINESLIWDREHDGIVIPAKLFCLNDSKQYRDKHLEKDKQQTDTSLAARCLCEFVTSQKMNGGTGKASICTLEYLLALMKSIVTYGSQYDSLQLNMADVKAEKLGSGRYSITDDMFQDSIEQFSVANNEEEINKHLASFSRRLSVDEVNTTPKSAVIDYNHGISSDDVNAAFKKDWGITFSEMDAFCYACFCLALKNETSSLDISRQAFITEILSLQPVLTENTIDLCIEHFSLSCRDSYLKAPAGYQDNEVYPWAYNREFSYVRRFIMVYSLADGSERFVFGPRSAMAALRQLVQLVSTGRIKYETPMLKILKGRINEYKGRAFNEEVRLFLKSNSSLIVLDYEPTIKPGGTLSADKDYGDVDVMAFDKHNGIVFLLECKDTEKARNVREMKAELDKYFGRSADDKKAYLNKHLARHNWVMEHLELVKHMLKTEKTLTVRSLLITSEVIPVSYISKTKMPLPIIAFSTLKYRGIETLYGSS